MKGARITADFAPFSVEVRLRRLFVRRVIAVATICQREQKAIDGTQH
jgi:hypothetical protein